MRTTLRWTWDRLKSRANLQKHGLDFDTAQHVFEDPMARSRRDLFVGDERRQTIGVVGGVTIIVVHTWPADATNGGDEVGRIISARKATSRERRTYEQEEF